MKSFAILAAVAAIASLAGCGGPHHMMHARDGGAGAVATLEPTRGNQTAGTVSFEQQGPNVLVVARVTGLKPNQEHGFHVHEKGDCSSGDGASAGGHFNPNGKPHGPQHAEHHMGDMPTLKADANGVADARFVLSGVSVGSGPADVVGRSIIVHADPDDYKTQPTGNSGARIACGVIKAR
jgi:Cu-Zn family superoxide dismutase